MTINLHFLGTLFFSNMQINNYVFVVALLYSLQLYLTLTLTLPKSVYLNGQVLQYSVGTADSESYLRATLAPAGLKEVNSLIDLVLNTFLLAVLWTDA